MEKRITFMAALMAATLASGSVWAAAGDSDSKDDPGMNGPATPLAPGATGNNRDALDQQKLDREKILNAPTAKPQAQAAPMARSSLDVAGLHELTKDQDKTTYNGISAKNLEDMNIVNPTGKKIGEIDKVLATNDNKVVAVVVDAGGILGIGGDKVVVPLDQLTLDSKGKQFVASMDEKQLKAMSKWQPKAGTPAR